MAHKIISKSERSGALDLFRFLAVLVVFFGHYVDTFNYVYHIVPANLKWSPISRYSVLALLVFFMVSGYVITMTSMKRGIKDFLIARLSRIYPLFWVSCIAAFFIPRIIHHNTYLMYSSLKMLLFNLTMMPQVFGYDMINPVFYTLLIELLFYFFIAFIIVFKLWNRILIIISILLIYCLIHFQDTAPVITQSIPSFLFIPAFLAGMLWYFIKIKYASLWKLYGLLTVNFLCTITPGRVAINILGKFYKDPNALNIWVIIAIMSIVYFVFYLIVTNKAIIKNSAYTRVLGEIAYPFYLFHVYFLFIYWYFRDTVQPDILVISILIVILAVCWALNVMVERPLSKLASQILYTITGFFSKWKNERTQLPGQEPPPL